MDKELDGYMRRSMKMLADRTLEKGIEEITIGAIYDGYTRDGTVMELEVCEPDFDQSKYWIWKTYKRG